MIDPRYSFYRKYHVNPNGILNFFFIESIKFKKRIKKRPTKYGLYKLTLNYARNAYGRKDLKYYQLYYLIRQYKKFMNWIRRGKPIDTLE